MTGEPGRDGPRQLFRARLPEPQNKCQGHNTRKNQVEPLGLITFGDRGSVPRVTQGASPADRRQAVSGTEPFGRARYLLDADRGGQAQRRDVADEVARG